MSKVVVILVIEREHIVSPILRVLLTVGVRLLEHLVYFSRSSPRKVERTKSLLVVFVFV